MKKTRRVRVYPGTIFKEDEYDGDIERSNPTV